MSVHETTEVIKTVPGGIALLDFFGEVPVTFHDAEVSGLLLDRRGPSWLDIVLIWRQPEAIVRFHLTDWIDLNIRGFSHQNVVGELNIRRAGERHVDPWELGVGLVPGEHEIELEPIFGAFGTLRCTIKKIELR